MEKEVNQPRRSVRADTAEPKIDFKPLTKGLGFHPFSDGLPYAPISKTANPTPNALSTSRGTGATAAGPASFLPSKSAAMPLPHRGVVAAPPRATATRVHVPTAHSPHSAGQLAPISPAIPGRYIPATPGGPRSPAAFAAASMAASSVVGTSVPRTGSFTHPGIETEHTLVYTFKRVLAYCLDTGLNVTLSAAALSFALWNQNLNPELLVNPAILFISILFFAMFNWALVTAQEIIFGTSFGKRVFRLALQGSTSAIFLRAFFFLPSLGFAGLGLVWALFDPQRRCWHDLVVDLQPIEIAKL